MWPYHPDLLTTAVPRYTSYPTAADFGVLADSDQRDAIAAAQGDVSLYVHIPFCESICYYCGCNTGAVGKRQRLQSYLDALHREISMVASILPRTARVRRVAFGGGSPNALAPVDFVRLVDAMTAQFAFRDPVFSIELDPRTMTAQWAKAIGSIGIARASLGVQTFAAHCQQAIGRVQDEELIVRTVDLLRTAGVTSLNFDLMYGLPGQELGDLCDTLERAHVLLPDRIALFGYAHVPHLVPRQRMIDATALPDQAERFSMAASGYDLLCARGYLPIGFDHFARAGSDPLARAAADGTLRRNFQGFTDDDAPVLIGLGSSAISSFPDLLAQNEKNAGRYRMLTSQGRLSAGRGIRVNDRDRLCGSIIEDLLCRQQAVLPIAAAAGVADALQPFLARGLVTLDGNLLSITPEGLAYGRTIAAQFDDYRQPASRQFSSAI
ncbi:oxygen-independent coproporphyrinogen III oxidase [Croceicoccus sp. F390]|uniref:Coproporphyrinogen-III oxidase n=1 Tax=Croceicoccus esteveae TaxID=3075597 RepID=A0ABU2ZH77_9SPHN|nr:oxygen-independent coproporphyrinogen III oxidase [Croceicoccus sp. F390]MDT0574949.1 oxygen-independent coproporphyrinogen III oxidase [Croceicoccus sp. F390]